jgi:hypothetical protein
MSFLTQVIQTTKESNKKYKMERAEYDRASNVLYDIAERKIKKCVLQRAKDGYTDATFDVIDDLKLDIAGKWSIPELLFAVVFEDAPPVVSRLFYLSNSPFDGFAISTKAKGVGPPSTFVLDWAYEMLKPKPQTTPPIKPQTTSPVEPQTTPPVETQPTPPVETQPTPPVEPQPTPLVSPANPYNPLAHNIFSDSSLSSVTVQELIDYLAAITGGHVDFSGHSTPPTKLRVQTPPGAPMKSNNSVIRNIFADTSIPPLTDQQLIDYLNALNGGNLYPN